MSVKNLGAHEVARLLKQDAIVLIDVREPVEYAAERIHGALLYPLSRFDPQLLPDCGKKALVFQCASGVRSVNAINVCRAAGLAVDSHLQGGIKAWKAAGLPTISLNPATSRTR
jgi:rhodanese-related sulfurtransferase